MSNRWGISKHVEDLVRERDLNCVYCGISFISTIPTYKTRPTWEHIVNDVRLRGEDNVALCCGSCNASKGSKLLMDWLKSNYCSTKGITEKSVAMPVKSHLAEK